MEANKQKNLIYWSLLGWLASFTLGDVVLPPNNSISIRVDVSFLFCHFFLSTKQLAEMEARGVAAETRAEIAEEKVRLPSFYFLLT